MEEFMKLNHGMILMISSSLVLLLFSSPLAQCQVASSPSPSPSPSPSQAPQQFQSRSQSRAHSPSQNNHNQQYLHSRLPKRRPKHTLNDQADIIASINKICSVTQDPKLCAESILPHVRGHVDPVMALQTEIKTFVGIMGTGITEIKASLKHSSTGTSTADCLRLCLDMYDTARMDLKQALEAINSHDIGLLNSLLSGVITNIGTCDDALSESGEELPLDTKLVDTIHKLADNCMDISAVLLT